MVNDKDKGPNLSEIFYSALEYDAKNSIFMRMNFRMIKLIATVGVVVAFGMGLLIRVLSSF